MSEEIAVTNKPIAPRKSSEANRRLRLGLALGAAALVVAGGITVMAKSGSGSAAPGSRVGFTSDTPVAGVYYADQARPQGGPALFTISGDQLLPFKNGDAIKAGTLDIAVTLRPYPPGKIANADFAVTRAGSPVEDADVTLSYDMAVMAHGPFTLLAVPAGGGHYLVPLDFPMSGDYFLNMAFSEPKQETVLNFAIHSNR